MTRELAKLLILAQASSDAGKGIWTLSNTLQEKLQKKAWNGYPEKDRAIYSMVSILSVHPRKDIHFFIVRDAEKVANYLVYFDFLLNGQKVQVSFHSYDERLKKFLKGSRKSCTEWREELVSRDVCFALAERFGYLRPGFTVSP